MTEVHEDHDIDQQTDKAGETADAPRDRGRKPASRLRKILAVVGIVAGTATLLAGGYVGYLYASSPVSIREPLPEHYHLRLQVLVNGKAENFADAKYQEGYAKDNCSALLTSSPIHFHDQKDQFVHIHWEGMTGGQVLKYYGWNFIGGLKDSLGYRFDDKHRLQRVPIHGKALPAIPEDATFYVYLRTDDGYTEKRFEDFTQQDLEVFLGRTSNYPGHELNKQKRSFLDQLRTAIIPTAQAHDGHDHGSTAGDDPTLVRLNNLLGDVVIFVQKDKPAADQIKARFDDLEPLTDSSCGG